MPVTSVNATTEWNCRRRETVSTSLIRGVDPNGEVRTVAVDEEGRVLTNGGDGSSNGSGGSDSSPTIEEIKTAVGAKEDETADSLSGYAGRSDWGIVSLLRGIFGKLEYALNGYVGFFVNVTNSVQTYPANSLLTDFSGTIQNPNISFVAIEYPNHKWLLLQNLGRLNLETGLYEGDLWVNIDLIESQNLGEYLDPVANVGPGSYQLKPGEKLTFQGSVIPYGRVALLGTIAGIGYTLKKA